MLSKLRTNTCLVINMGSVSHSESVQNGDNFGPTHLTYVACKVCWAEMGDAYIVFVDTMIH
jgi:hypothetical protein